MIHYGPLSYTALGWVSPRDQLRSPPPRADRRSRRGLSVLFPAPTPPPTLARNLLAAIHQRFQATPALVAAIPGKLWTNQIPDDMPYPCASITEISAARDDRNTSGFVFKTHMLQVTILITANDAETVGKDLVDLWEDTFSPKSPSLVFLRGYTTFTGVTDDHFEGQDQQSEDAERIKFQIIEMKCVVGREPAP